MVACYATGLVLLYLGGVALASEVSLGPLVAARRGQNTQFLTDVLTIVAVIAGMWLSLMLLGRVIEFLEMSRKAALYTKKAKIAQGALQLLQAESSLCDSLVAQAYADFFYLRDLDAALQLETKKRPAPIAAERIREQAAERRQVEKLARLFQEQVKFYETLCPWLADFKEAGFDELVRQVREGTAPESHEEEREDPVFRWVPEAKYQKMSPSTRNQLALERYWQKTKNPWEVGRDYERFVGYQYEIEGFQVYYQGIAEGLSDLGRDLIVSRGGMVEIVQCKYWSREKQIHEKHMFQLYGTTVEYQIDHPGVGVKAMFVTSTALSERAKKAAQMLNIAVRENYPLEPYPCIKCNVAQDGTKIYHLPFDQQYDRTIVEPDRGECYVATVRQAEARGFRRAYRWTGVGE